MRTRTDHRPRARRSAHLQALHRRAARRGMQRLRQDPPRLPAPRRETALQQLPTAAPGREEVLQPLRQRTPGAHDHCGRPLCPECAPGKVEPCVHCGRTARVRVRFTGGATCSPCFNVIRNTRRPCPRCQRVTLVASVADDGTLACTPCAGRSSPFICVSCGIEDIRHGKKCYPCSARDAVDALFAAGTPDRQGCSSRSGSGS